MLSDRDIAWAAGFLEGEGSFGCYGKRSTIIVEAAQVQTEPLHRLKAIFGGHIEKKWSSGNPRHAKALVWRATGLNAAGIMMTLWTDLSPKRRSQIESALRRWIEKPLPPHWLSRLTGFCAKGHKIEDGNRANRGGCLICKRAGNAARGRAMRRRNKP